MFEDTIKSLKDESSTTQEAVQSLERHTSKDNQAHSWLKE